jgi:hypothetical protein
MDVDDPVDDFDFEEFDNISQIQPTRGAERGKAIEEDIGALRKADSLAKRLEEFPDITRPITSNTTWSSSRTPVRLLVPPPSRLVSASLSPAKSTEVIELVDSSDPEENSLEPPAKLTKSGWIRHATPSVGSKAGPHSVPPPSSQKRRLDDDKSGIIGTQYLTPDVIDLSD